MHTNHSYKQKLRQTDSLCLRSSVLSLSLSLSQKHAHTHYISPSMSPTHTHTHTHTHIKLVLSGFYDFNDLYSKESDLESSDNLLNGIVTYSNLKLTTLDTSGKDEQGGRDQFRKCCQFLVSNFLRQIIIV